MVKRMISRDAENALERDEQVANELADVEAAVGPRRRQVGSEIGVRDERERDGRNDPAGGAPRRLQQQHDEHHAEHDIEPGRRGGAVGELLAALDGVDQDGGAGDPGDDVTPADAVAEPRREREQEEAQDQHEGVVRVAQRLGRDDREIGERPGAGDRGIEVEQRHRHRDRGHQRAGPTGEPVDHALLGLDEGLSLPQLRLGNSGRRSRHGRFRGLPRVLGHVPSPVLSRRPRVAIRPGPGRKSQIFSPPAGSRGREIDRKSKALPGRTGAGAQFLTLRQCDRGILPGATLGAEKCPQCRSPSICRRAGHGSPLRASSPPRFSPS